MSERKFYVLTVIFMSFFSSVFIGIELFGLSPLVGAFVFFGIPIIISSVIFWYELVEFFLDR